MIACAEAGRQKNTAMRLFRSIVASATLLAALAPVHAQDVASPQSNGVVVAQAPCGFTTFEEQSAFTRRFYSKDEYEGAKNNTTIECLRIQYVSDGLKVVGYIVKPRTVQGRRYPIIIYNRGGFLETGKIDAWNLLDFYRLASSDFVVVASQYRGNDGGEGREEVGGADVDDVMNLWPLAATLPYVDMQNVFMYGLSRGGMMTFLALKRGARVNAAAVLGAVYDVEAFGRRAPGIVERATRLIPDFASRGTAVLKERSAMNWPDQINVPLLMIHGGKDQEVPASEALAFASKLSDLSKTYQLIVYADDIHEAANNGADRDAKIIAWFKRYLR
jgi:dipeptidyl aminopeptidase/acylaminoacyl peptidase